MLTSSAIEGILEKALRAVDACSELKALDAIRLQFLGKKGELALLMKSVSTLEPDERRTAGQLLNRVRSELEESLGARRRSLEEFELQERLAGEWIDVTLPVGCGVPFASRGSLHPLTQVRLELEQIFCGLGFDVVDGPEVESEYYNFEALNIPSSHPARDMQDTFWLRSGDLLRTHTSAMQVRALQNGEPPLRLVGPGRCFRYEALDASHEHTFYQMEGMMVDRQVSVGHLIYFMKTLLREIFGYEPKIRLRPGYFPFVEPGFELDIWFNGRWLELLPCGLIHPRVLDYGGIDPAKWQGFAFGLGLSRLVMTRFGIDDIRHLQASDVRFLSQF